MAMQKLRFGPVFPLSEALCQKPQIVNVRRSHRPPLETTASYVRSAGLPTAQSCKKKHSEKLFS
jgi:hypothetical protein